LAEPETGWEEETGHYSTEEVGDGERKKIDGERQGSRTEEHFVSTVCW